MVLSDVLKQIVPCNRQKPYIFISYSSNDKELVWQDALEFQRQGYNIWLDEKNLDKTKSSWKEDALLAIQDMYCVLLVFYVSKSSLTSEACYNELAKTVDEFSIALHMGPVKFIAIDVDEVGNIGDFSRNLYKDIFSNAELSKEAKSKMMLTMHNFMKNFFDSNNEKVRIHPKNEPNRKMNYYEEILASFPDEACTLEKAKAAAAVAVEHEKTADKAEEKQKSLSAKMTSHIIEKIAEKTGGEEKSEEKTDEISEETSEDTRKESDTDLVKALGLAKETKEQESEAAKENNENNELTRLKMKLAIKRANSNIKNEMHLFKLVPELTPKKMKNACQLYVLGVSESDVVGFWDTSLRGNGKCGFLVTVDKIYSDEFKKSFIDLKRLESFKTGRNKYDLDIVYSDGIKETLFVATCHQEEIKILLTEVQKIKNGE